MELNFEIGNYKKPLNKNLFYGEKDKEFFLNENYGNYIVIKKPIIYSRSINVSKEMQNYEESLELKLKKKFNC